MPFQCAPEKDKIYLFTPDQVGPMGCKWYLLNRVDNIDVNGTYVQACNTASCRIGSGTVHHHNVRHRRVLQEVQPSYRTARDWDYVAAIPVVHACGTNKRPLPVGTYGDVALFTLL